MPIRSPGGAGCAGRVGVGVAGTGCAGGLTGVGLIAAFAAGLAFFGDARRAGAFFASFSLTAPERAAPFHHCRVEVRMRDSDSLQATEPVDQGNGRQVQHRNAVPQDISIGCANNQRTLADRKLWLCSNADYSSLVLAV